MNVTVSVFGRFHAFYLARELQHRGHLRRLITSHPGFSVSRWGVSTDHLRSFWPLEAGRRALGYLPVSLTATLGAKTLVREAYERLAAGSIPTDTDLFVGWSNTAERGLRRGRELGAVTIVERCSSHIRTQREILREEYTGHGSDPVLPPDEVVRQEEREYELADYVAVPSSFVERTFLERGFPQERILKIPYGVDPEEFEPVGKEDKVFRVVYAGQLGHRKGVRYLLEAWEKLDLDDAELLLLGPVRPEFEPWMEQYAGQYRHPGSLPQSELHKWYSQGSVFVLPSVEEGMAYVQLQAMACGLPLVCTPNTGGEDLIREGEEGFVVPIRDVEALEERILWCYEHQEECLAMGRSARQRMLRRFTWRDYGDRIVDAYDRILSKDDGATA